MGGADFLDTLEFSNEDFLPDQHRGAEATTSFDGFPVNTFQDEIEDDSSLLRDITISDDAAVTGDADEIQPHDLDDGDESDQDNFVAFVNMVEREQVGSLEDEDLQIMRDIISSPIIADEDDRESLELRGRVLYRLVDEWLETSNDKVSPSVDDFVMCLKGWNVLLQGKDQTFLKDLLPAALDYVSNLWLDLEQLHTNTQLDALKPTAETVELTLQLFALASPAWYGLDRQADSILRSAVHKHGISATPSMYETVVFLLAKSRAPGAAERAERVLREACENVGAQHLRVESFNVVLTAWAKSRDTNSPARAEQVLVFMTDQEVKPNASSFTSLIDAYGQKSDWACAVKCEGILLRMLNLYLEGDENLEPSIVSWAVVMSTWTRLAKKGHQGAAEKAEDVLQQLEDLHSEERIPYGPDAMIYITCMNANIFSKTPQGLKRAIEILHEMNEVYLDGDESYKPSARSINMILDGLIHSTIPNKLVKAETVLEKYKSMLLDDARSPEEQAEGRVKGLWRTMIYGWAQAGNPIQAQHYLMEMVDHNLALDSACFDRVIEANYKTDDARAMLRSFEVFEVMEKCRLEGRVKPNERVYTSFIRAMCRSHVPDVATKAMSLINRMTELYLEGNAGIQPTVFTYNALLFACSSVADSPSSNDRKQTLQIALSTFDTLRTGSKDIHPDHVSFGNMLRCAKLLPEGHAKRDSWIQSAFQLCCQRGLLNSFVLSDLQLASSAELLERLLGNGALSLDEPISIDRLPAEWSRNNAQKVSKRSGQRSRRPTRSSSSHYSRR